MTNICVVGQNGFIGSVLKLSLESINKYNLYFIKSNLLDKEMLCKEVRCLPEIDTLIFLVGGFGNNLADMINVNVVTLSNCLEELKSKGVKNIIFASTGAVYGEPLSINSIEEDALSPNTFYGLSKKYSEDLLKYYFDNFKINVLILRYPNVYGPNNQKGVVYNFIKSIKKNKTIFFEGDGSEMRNFLYVDDAVKSIILSLTKVDSTNIDKPFFKVINISDEKLFSLIDLSNILKNMGFVFDIEKSNSVNDNNIKILSLKSAKLKEFLNWRPEVSLEEGIKKIIEYNKDEKVN